MSDTHQPLRDLINRSGVPFQLAVENAMRTRGAKHSIEVWREVPWANGFIDIVAKISDRIFCAVECKRVTDRSWSFVLTENARESATRCRIEWFNSKAVKIKDCSRVFCSEWNMVEPSPESEFCILPKDTPIGSLESVCRGLIASCHNLLESEAELVLNDDIVAMIPVIVTNAKLYTCKMDAISVSLETGLPNEAGSIFQPVEMLRFRKSLVNQRSNSYRKSQMVLSDWIADRERTVFILTPSGIDRFLNGMRAFGTNYSGGFPDEYLNPPNL